MEISDFLGYLSIAYAVGFGLSALFSFLGRAIGGAFEILKIR